MNYYYIKTILLENCPYSIMAIKLLKLNNIKHIIFYVNNNNKNNYITDNIKTFPQFYLKNKNKKGNLLLGGYEDLNNFILTFKNKNYNINNINNFIENKKWSMKATLRLIELIN